MDAQEGAAAATFGRGADKGASAPIALLPLQVGATAHWSFTRVPVPIALGIAVLLYVHRRASEGGLGDAENLTGVLLLSLLAVLCFGYAAFHLHGAIVTRASDLVVTAEGIRVAGSRGAHLRWGELSPPYAAVEEGSERQLSLLGAVLFVLSVFRAAWPVRTATVWSLRIHTGAGARLVAKSDREIEARSMDAAAQTIVATKEGRRQVEEIPRVTVELLSCPECGAPVIPADAAQVACPSCGAGVALEPRVREQAAAASAMRESRRRLSVITRRLLEQPRAESTNRWLAALWLVMLAPWAVTLATFVAYESSALDRIAWGLHPLVLWLVPPAVMLAAWAVGRVKLVSRGALQLLTLGFGALAPARPGEPPRCRRCHGPLDGAAVGAVVPCAYCRADNVTGIDMRPFVDKARAEQQSLDDVLGARARSRRVWRTVAVAGVLCAAAGTLLVAESIRILGAS